MRFAHLLFALTASLAFVTAQAQTTEKAQPKAAASATKPAAKAEQASRDAAKTTKVEAAAVRSTPVDLKKSADKNYGDCGHGKVTAATDL